MGEARIAMKRRQRVEDGLSLRVTALAPHSSFRRGFRIAGELCRSAVPPGEAAETIAWAAETETDFSGRIRFAHSYPGASEVSCYSVALVAVDRPFGGLRWMWQSSDGDGLCHVLHLPPGAERFASRRAHRLVYASQSQSRAARAAEQAVKLREALGGSADLCAPFPPRPRLMRTVTFERRRCEIEALTAEALRQPRVRGVPGAVQASV